MTTRDLWLAYARGFAEGASVHPRAAITTLSGEPDDLRAEYERGLGEGRQARTALLANAAKRIGYQPASLPEIVEPIVDHVTMFIAAGPVEEMAPDPRTAAEIRADMTATGYACAREVCACSGKKLMCGCVPSGSGAHVTGCEKCSASMRRYGKVATCG